MLKYQQVIVEPEPDVRQAEIVHGAGGEFFDELFEVVAEVANGGAGGVRIVGGRGAIGGRGSCRAVGAARRLAGRLALQRLALQSTVPREFGLQHLEWIG